LVHPPSAAPFSDGTTASTLVADLVSMAKSHPMMTRADDCGIRRLELGVFLPNARNGFFFSSNAVPYAPSYDDNLAITVLAEEIGLDYVFSMLKWRGFGGATHFWDAALESFSLMAALAAVTQRVGLIATVNPLLFHPATMAKMAA